MPVDVRRFPWVKRLAADYAFNFSSLAPFFAGDPSDAAAWRSAIARTQAYERRRSDVASLLRSQQSRRAAPPEAVAAVERLTDARTVAVLTGQQAGLFGGPTFTLLKALTALKLAEQVSRDHGVPTVAIFWIDAEDHDWDEVRSCTVLDDQDTPRSVELPARPGADAVAVAEIRLDASIANAIDALERILPATEFRGSLVADLRQAYAVGRGMTEAFGCWLERVLGNRGLIVFDASDPASKPLVSQLFTRELSAPGQTAKLAATAGADLEAHGYHVQVQSQVDGLALFRLDGSRRPIRREDGQFVVGETRYPAAVLIQEAAERPALFSPNVLLRPVVQDVIFPTICYVAGPNELAYLGQLRGVYEHFGVPMPLMYPRAGATLIDRPAARFLTRYNLPLEALQAQDDRALNELLKAEIPRAVEESIADAAAAVESAMTRVIQALPGLDPTLEGAARSTLSRMQHDLESLHGKTIQAAKRRNETLRRQFLHARALAFPNGQAQERAIGFVSFLNQYGPALIERLNTDLPIDMGQHWVITI
jgi:bacillithiol biosynthesis cysteine-adding enzyme BshC